MTSGRYTVAWTDVASNDMERIATYLAHDSPTRAANIVDHIVRRGESLSFAPMRGRTLPELRGVTDQTWREVQEPPWRIVYRVAPDRRVEIHGVLDSRRSLEDLLLDRLLQSY